MKKTAKVAEVIILPDGRMDTKNAAIYTGYSEKTLAMKRCNGTGPEFVKLGRIFYYQEVLDEWIRNASAQKSTTQLV